MKIPLVDLYAQYQLIKPEIDEAIESVIKKSSFIRGEYVQEFEKGFSELLGVKHCISCGNGTDALYIAMKMMGIGPGDEIITTSHSWIATSETISQTGAKVVFVDTERDTFTIDVNQIEPKINSRTKAIIPVHLYGHPAEMEPIMEIAKKYGLKVIEDCAQAHLAEYMGTKVGGIGDIATYSFYPGKNLGAYGDAGAIVTNDATLAEKCRKFANHGALIKHEHHMEGINSRLDGLQAAILNVKLKYLEEWTAQRIKWANMYDQLLHDIDGIQIPGKKEGCRHVYHLYVIRTRKRDALKEYLADHGIGTTIQYPTALPFLPAYKYLEHSPKDFEVSFDHQDTILSIPLYPELDEQKVQYVASHMKQFYYLNGAKG
ncbi:DegT/DnrJ/EryC1/StrS family aminotransferase [Fulvivirga sp. M361]|uniref:DegT/DnrJ/EryC1/StrS family aminotransferase n=1 Tax=Fulvivirga sp. M361 TaxID=2594266 RepID=UPI00117A02D9|nr:DegT/DnrJ/EryC1/StrS family aminotransferase [Fulvivirga sp. M361]TRX50224.1 DegT/DnrJ/EryC1/StrS family aminotransferase [Fulvivirga sp. M361]